MSHKRNSKEYNVKTYDPALYQQKCHFFYDTSFDILFKGPDDRTRFKNLDIFSQFHNKSHFKIANTSGEHSTEIKTPLNNTTTKPSILFRSQQNFHKRKTRPLKLSRSIHSFGSTCHFFNNTAKTVNKYSKFYKSLSQFNIHRGNIKDLEDGSETVIKYTKVITELDRIINNLNQTLIKENNTESYQVLRNDYGTERERVLKILIDYFGPMHYQKIKERYNTLFGKDTYFKHILHETSRIFPKKELRDKTKSKTNAEEDGKKPLYVDMLQDVPNKKYIVKNKYSRCGKAKILNVPKEFFENDIELDSVMNRKNVVIDNVKEIYSLSTPKEKYKYDFFTKLSKANDTLKNSKLKMIRNTSEDIAEKTIQTKMNIINLNNFLQKKSPLLSHKRFAYIQSDVKMLFPIPLAKRKKYKLQNY